MKNKYENTMNEELLKNIVQEFPRKHGYVVSIANGKGGIGRTTISNLLAYNLAKLGLKTLIIDACKQGNTTKTMLLTKKNNEDIVEDLSIKQSFMQGLIKSNLEDSVIPIMDNLHLIPSFKDTGSFARNYYMNIKYDIDRAYFLDESIRKIQFFYDFIIIDSPAGNIELNQNIALASDYIIIACQPTEYSIASAESFKINLNKLKENFLYDAKFEILGILPSKINRVNRMERKLLHNLNNKSEYYIKEYIFNSILYLTETVKIFEIMGITNNNLEKQYVHDKYNEVILEILQRINHLD